VDKRQLAELRRWATRLQETGSSDELRASGKAILMLTEEVASLTLQLEAARSAAEEAEREPEPDAESAEHGRWSWFRRTFGLGVFDDDYSESEPG
jgi:hypothetical protein